MRGDIADPYARRCVVIHDLLTHRAALADLALLSVCAILAALCGWAVRRWGRE